MGPTWRDRAACWTHDPAVFFPNETAGYLEAKQICRDCPVILACLDEAVEMGERGVWGGTSEETREELAKARRRGFLAYHQEIQRVMEQLGREVSGFPDERPVQSATTCPRCGDPIPEGRWPKDRNGPGATCGFTATYNKGCRCRRCSAAKSESQARTKAKRKAREALPPDGDGA